MGKPAIVEMIHPDIPISKEGYLNFYASIPCSIKNRFTDVLNKFLTDYDINHNIPVYSPLTIRNTHKILKPGLREIKNENILPDLFLSFGFGTMYSEPFRSLFMENKFITGYTDLSQKSFLPEKMKTSMNKYGFGILALGSWQLLVNINKLDDFTPRAKSWDDLLKPEFKGLITMHGHENKVSITSVHHYYYEKYGIEGIQTFGENLKGVKHFSGILKAMANPDRQNSVYYILPSTIAIQIPEKLNILPVSLKEGDIISPLLINIRKSSEEKVRSFLEFFHSKPLTDLLQKSGYYTPESLN